MKHLSVSNGLWMDCLMDPFALEGKKVQEQLSPGSMEKYGQPTRMDSFPVCSQLRSQPPCSAIRAKFIVT